MSLKDSCCPGVLGNENKKKQKVTLKTITFTRKCLSDWFCTCPKDKSHVRVKCKSPSPTPFSVAPDTIPSPNSLSASQLLGHVVFFLTLFFCVGIFYFFILFFSPLIILCNMFGLFSPLSSPGAGLSCLSALIHYIPSENAGHFSDRKGSQFTPTAQHCRLNRSLWTLVIHVSPQPLL